MEHYLPGDKDYAELKEKYKKSLTKQDSKTVDIIIDSAYFILGELHFLSETLMIYGFYQRQANDIFGLKNENISQLFKSNSNAIVRTLYNSFFNMLSRGKKNTQVSFQQLISFFVTYNLKEPSMPQLLDNKITKTFLNNELKVTEMVKTSTEIFNFLVERENEISYIEQVRHRISGHNSVERLKIGYVEISNIEYVDAFIGWTQSLLNIILDTNKSTLEEEVMRLSNTLEEITQYLGKWKKMLKKGIILYKD